MLSNKIIEIMRQHSDKLVGQDLFDLLLHLFTDELMSAQDKHLLNFIFSKEPTQERLLSFLSGWDIEVAGSARALMLAYFMKMNPELQFTNYELPRLRGLLKFYRFHNLQLMMHYTKIGKALNQNDIPVMILKGGAMRYLRPDLPRVMGDIDTLVPGENFIQSAKIARDLGYTHREDEELTEHSVDLHEPNSEAGTVDIHRYLAMETGHGEELYSQKLFQRATQVKVFGVNTFFPCHEDILFIALVNLARNLVNNTSINGVLYNLFDCQYLLESKKDFDWNIVMENIKITKTDLQINLATRFLNSIIPNLLPSLITRDSTFNKNVEKYCDDIFFHRFYFLDLQTLSRSISIKNIFKSCHNFLEYIVVKPKYKIVKKLKDTKTFVNIFMHFKKRSVTR